MSYNCSYAISGRHDLIAPFFFGLVLVQYFILYNFILFHFHVVFVCLLQKKRHYDYSMKYWDECYYSIKYILCVCGKHAIP